MTHNSFLSVFRLFIFICLNVHEVTIIFCCASDSNWDNQTGDYFEFYDILILVKVTFKLA